MQNIHGGDIYTNPIEYDFSVNINPLGVPEGVRNALHEAVNDCSNYPDIASGKLKNAVSNILSIPKEYLLFGNGASELFMAIVHAIKPEKTVIPIPSFYGYEYATIANNGDIIYYETKIENNFHVAEDILTVLKDDINLLFLANPNNPTGNLISRDLLLKILRHCMDRDILVVLDECFIELTDAPLENSLVDELKEFKQLLILRAFTKSFAIPGIRLGYLVCPDEKTARLIEEQLPEWNVSVPAQQAGIAAMKEENFLQQSRKLIANERDWLTKELTQMGAKVFPSKANFILFQWTKDDLYQRFLEQGILIRDCSDYEGLSKGYYRIAVKKHEENEELIRIMHSVVKED